ncbi:17-beta-hydroxysteroid dehydrogenase 14-like [Biomphalaria glabrata]|uniref:17-beta-hydroxysteroid dehydrogenase 14-like n=1 Tax=Biomphalaria glabrata TaxID=6526 RepID=A0A9U8E0G1_BIOGL|nr:17-beta-hydroxysteroid dehydrogenase 14-like [Biomphalaria glabrata]KAI8783252.1 17-beta-hydroxysteroid dehydrogenase 14 [Biomphalaria glabrata]
MPSTCSLRYKDKVVIVTGGASGIGLGAVKTFVENGSKVVFCDLNEKDGLSVETSLNAEGPGECKFIVCDVSNEEQVKKLIDFTVETFGKLDCLVNNAGVHPPHKPVDDFSSEEFKSLLDVNVIGFFHATKYAIPHLRKTQGNIINNGSLVAYIGQPGAVTYAASKGAVISMTKALAIDEAKYNVRVNSFSPGNIFTPLWEKAALASPDYNKCIQAGKDAQLLGRFGTIEECGLVCLFLAADATFCTGININVSGGAELDYGYKNKTTLKE